MFVCTSFNKEDIVSAINTSSTDAESVPQYVKYYILEWITFSWVYPHQTRHILP